MFRATLRSARHTPFGVSGRDGSATASTALNPDDKPFVIFGKSLIFFWKISIYIFFVIFVIYKKK